MATAVGSCRKVLASEIIVVAENNVNEAGVLACNLLESLPVVDCCIGRRVLALRHRQ